jgi:hypothetical protein
VSHFEAFRFSPATKSEVACSKSEVGDWVRERMLVDSSAHCVVFSVFLSIHATERSGAKPRDPVWLCRPTTLNNHWLAHAWTLPGGASVRTLLRWTDIETAGSLVLDG